MLIDQIDEVLNADYKQETMIMQLRKIVDSIGNPKPINHVVADNGRNGRKLWVAHKHAKTLVEMYDVLTSADAKSTDVQSRQDPSINAVKRRAKQQLVDSMQSFDTLEVLVNKMKRMG